MSSFPRHERPDPQNFHFIACSLEHLHVSADKMGTGPASWRMGCAFRRATRVSFRAKSPCFPFIMFVFHPSFPCLTVNAHFRSSIMAKKDSEGPDLRRTYGTTSANGHVGRGWPNYCKASDCLIVYTQTWAEVRIPRMPTRRAYC